MSRAETTAMLSKLVEKRLKNRVSFWASEVNFDLGTSKKQTNRLHGIQAVHARLCAHAGKCGTWRVLLLRSQVLHGGFQIRPWVDVLRGRELPRDHKGTGRGTASQLPAATQYQSSAHTIEKRRQARTAFRRVRQVPILQVPRRKRNAVRDDRSERKENELSKTIKYVECAHCGQRVGTYYVTCPYCGYKLVDAMQSIGEALPW